MNPICSPPAHIHYLPAWQLADKEGVGEKKISFFIFTINKRYFFLYCIYLLEAVIS